MRYTIKQRKNGHVVASGVPNQTVQDFEGHWYFEPSVVNMNHLKVTNRTYTCPYKGACYWIDLESPDTRVNNIGWVYRSPKPGYEFIKDQIAFYTRSTEATLAAKEAE
jgi:uncharacterized protein (DUF427 family)